MTYSMLNQWVRCAYIIIMSKQLLSIAIITVDDAGDVCGGEPR